MKRTYIFGAGIVLVIIILITGIINQTGYVMSGPYLVKGGSLIISSARPHSDVFIDNKRAGRVDQNGGGTFNGIKPGTRDVIVAHPEAWPWIFEFESLSGSAQTLYPLQVKNESPLIVLGDQTDPLRDRAETNFATYKEPTQNEPLEREGNKVWITGNSIQVQDNSGIRTIFSSPHPVRNISWLGDRNDAIVAAVNADVFALDTRQSQLQNFQPIYAGVAPEAVRDPIRSDAVFIRDEGKYYMIGI